MQLNCDIHLALYATVRILDDPIPSPTVLSWWPLYYFEVAIFSFNLYVYYLARGFIASTCTFNLRNHTFNLAIHAFTLLTCRFELVTLEFEIGTRVLLFHQIVSL